MGLDWHSRIPATDEYKEEYIRRYYAKELEEGASLQDLMDTEAPEGMKPCTIVGAKRMRELPDFKERLEEHLKYRQEDARKELESKGDKANMNYVNHWLGMTIEQYMEQDGDKWFCDTCPLLEELKDATSSGSMFIGITVASCDFRGKKISADEVLESSLRDEAYEEHDPEEMLEYADRLEEELVALEGEPCLEKDSYKDYLAEFNASTWNKAMGYEALTKEEYEKEPHWRKRNLLEAIHWLRTCASKGVYMGTSY